MSLKVTKTQSSVTTHRLETTGDALIDKLKWEGVIPGDAYDVSIGVRVPRDGDYSGSLDAVGSAFGIGSKRGHGASFAKLYSNPETRDQAVEYQRSEMQICDGLCQRFGLI